MFFVGWADWHDSVKRAVGFITQAIFTIWHKFITCMVVWTAKINTMTFSILIWATYTCATEIQYMAIGSASEQADRILWDISVVGELYKNLCWCCCTKKIREGIISQPVSVRREVERGEPGYSAKGKMFCTLCTFAVIWIQVWLFDWFGLRLYLQILSNPSVFAFT